MIIIFLPLAYFYPYYLLMHIHVNRYKRSGTNEITETLYVKPGILLSIAFFELIKSPVSVNLTRCHQQLSRAQDLSQRHLITKANQEILLDNLHLEGERGRVKNHANLPKGILICNFPRQPGRSWSLEVTCVIPSSFPVE